MKSIIDVFWDIILAILGAVAFAGLAAAGLFMAGGGLLFLSGTALVRIIKRRKQNSRRP